MSKPPLNTDYPFAPRFLEVDGGRMHYVDVGTGPAVVMVHGTPVWSYVYRRLIASLSRRHRVIAMDHIGFGKSDKPETWSYSPQDHAKNLSRLIEHLQVNVCTLVVNDFGGPIGLSHAIEHPDQVRSLVLFNTWMWETKGTPAARVGALMSTPLGRFLYLRMNVSPRVLLKSMFADKSVLTRSLHEAYLAPYPRPQTRHGLWGLAKALRDSSDWYASLWSRRDAVANKPTLVLWGKRDPAFKLDALEKWRSHLTRARVIEFDSGHFLQEEKPEEVLQAITQHLQEVWSPAPTRGADVIPSA